MLHPYQHPQLDAWLNGAILPQAVEVVERTQQLLVNHYNNANTVDLFNDNFMAEIDTFDRGVAIGMLFTRMTDEIIDVLSQYGILIETPVETTDLSKLNAMLYTAMAVSEFEDLKSIKALLDLGNNSREIFAEMVVLLNPECQVETLLPLIKEVFNTFLNEVIRSVKEGLEKLEQLEEDDLKEANQLRLRFIQGFEPYLNKYQLTLPAGLNRKLMKTYLRDHFKMISDMDDSEFTDICLDTTQSLLELINQNHYRTYALIYGYLLIWTKHLYPNFDILDSINDVPTYDILTDLDIRRNFTQVLLAVIEQYKLEPLNE